MKYFKLMFDYKNDDNLVCCESNDVLNFDRYDLMKGKSVIREWNSITLSFDPNQGTIFSDYLATVYGWLTVSERFIEAIKLYSSNVVEYLDFIVENRETKEVINTYKIANILDVVEAVDLNLSDYDIFEAGETKVISIKKYILKAKAVDSHHIFRPKEDIFSIFISEFVKNAIELNKLTGFSFLEVGIC